MYAADIGATEAGSATLGGVWATRLDDPDPEADPVAAEEMEFAQELVRGVLAERDAIDRKIEGASENWRLTRMPVVDRNILRIGAFELGWRTDIPASVAINEAIELAKRFGGAESRAFVNGILDRVASEVGRGGRRARK